MAEVVSFGETMLRLTPPAAGRVEGAQSMDLYVSGPESNALACMSRLGVSTLWLSALPANPAGRRVVNELKSHGVDTQHIVWSAGEKSRLGTYYAEDAAFPLGPQVWHDRTYSAFTQLRPDDVDLFVLAEAKLLYLTGVTPALGRNARTIFEDLLGEAAARKVPLAFDVNYRSKLWLADEAAGTLDDACRQADVLFCTLEDADELWGLTGNPETVLRQLARKFANENSKKTYVMTLGSEGATQLQGNVCLHVPALPNEGRWRFGLGDAFAAGYLYAYLGGKLFKDLEMESMTNEGLAINYLRFANAIASLKCCIAGDIATITLDEVRAVLRPSKRRVR